MTRILTIVAAAALAAALAQAQPKRLQLVINASSPEGQLLQKASQEQDPAARIAAAREFLDKNPNHEGATFALAIVEEGSVKLEKYDDAMDAAAKALAIDPTDLELAYIATRAADSKQDPAKVKEWALRTSTMARAALVSEKPQDVDADSWQKRMAYWKDIENFCDYALFAAITRTQDNAQVISLYEAFEKQSPKNAYLSKSFRRYLVAVNATSGAAQVLPAAEKARTTFPDNEDALMVLAGGYLAAKDMNKALAHALSLIQVMKTKEKPEEVSWPDWESKKNAYLGSAYFIAGMVQATTNSFVEADQNLRAAVPLIRADANRTGVATFYLSVVDFKLGDASKDRVRVGDALNFAKQSAGIPGMFQDQAKKNVAAIEKYLGSMKAPASKPAQKK